MNGDVGPADAPARQAQSRRPGTIDLQRQPSARPNDRAPVVEQRARSRRRPSGSAHERQPRLPVPNRRIERGVLRCRKIGGIGDQRVERRRGRAARRRSPRTSATARAGQRAGSRSASASASAEQVDADDLRRSRPRWRGSARCTRSRCRRRPPGRRGRAPGPARPVLRSRGAESARGDRSGASGGGSPSGPVTWASGSPAARRRTAATKASARSLDDRPSRRIQAPTPDPRPESSAQRRSASRRGVADARRRRAPRPPRRAASARHASLRRHPAPAGSPCAAPRPARRDPRRSRRQGCAPRD